MHASGETVAIVVRGTWLESAPMEAAGKMFARGFRAAGGGGKVN